MISEHWSYIYKNYDHPKQTNKTQQKKVTCNHKKLLPSFKLVADEKRQIALLLRTLPQQWGGWNRRLLKIPLTLDTVHKWEELDSHLVWSTSPAHRHPSQLRPDRLLLGQLGKTNVPTYQGHTVPNPASSHWSSINILNPRGARLIPRALHSWKAFGFFFSV